MLAQAEAQRALEAITSLALVARALPVEQVLEQVRSDRADAAAGLADAGAPLGTLDVLLRVVDACAALARTGDELDRTINEGRHGSTR